MNAAGPRGGFGVVGLGDPGSPPPHRTRPDLCGEHGHPGVTYNTSLDMTFCLCGASIEFGDSSTHGVACCGGVLTERYDRVASEYVSDGAA